MTALKHHRKLQLEERMRLAEAWEDHGLVFPKQVGKTMNAQEPLPPKLQADPGARRAAEDGARARPQAHLRYGTLILRRSPNVVQELLGHKNISITLDA